MQPDALWETRHAGHRLACILNNSIKYKQSISINILHGRNKQRYKTWLLIFSRILMSRLAKGLPLMNRVEFHDVRQDGRRYKSRKKKMMTSKHPITMRLKASYFKSHVKPYVTVTIFTFSSV